MSTTGRLRAEPEPVPERDKDYGDLLNENLVLLRQAEEKNKELLEVIHKRDELQELLNKELTKDRATKGYRGIRRKLIWLNFLIGLIVMFGPFVLWYKMHTHPVFIAIGILGVVWLILTNGWADTLADRES